MRKLKLIIPSIALIVVLAFSITIGVYAASSATFTISSTVVYIAPDLDVTIDAYIGEVKEENLKFSYPASSGPWEIADGELKFEKKDGRYQPIIITFVIANETNIPAFCYFTKKDAEDNTVLMMEDSLNGVIQTDKALVNVAVNIDEDVVENGIPAHLDPEVDKPTTTITMIFSLIERVTLIEDKVEFNDYTLKVSKRNFGE